MGQFQFYTFAGHNTCICCNKAPSCEAIIISEENEIPYDPISYLNGRFHHNRRIKEEVLPVPKCIQEGWGAAGHNGSYFLL